MKVTHVITPINYGGGENLILNLIKTMENRVNNSVLNLAYSSEFEKHLDKNDVNHARVSNKNLGASPKKIEYLIFLILNLFKVFLIKDKIEGKIIHAHGFPANIFIGFMKKLGLLKGKILIFTSHSEKKSERAIIKKVYSFFLKEYDKITCVGQKSYESMIKEFPELKDKIIKINNGIQLKDFYYKETNHRLKKDLNYEAEDKVAIFVSRLSHVKNHKFLLELMKEINNLEFKLLIIGEGEEKGNLEKIVKNYNLENRVKFLGFVKNEELVEYYSISDMVLFPSTSEGFGISIVEALVCRKPLILFRDIYFDELENGVLIAENEKDFINKTKELINDKELKEKLGINGERVGKNLSIENCSKNYENLYGSLYGKNINS